MKVKSVSSVITLFIALTFSVITKGQSFGITASAAYLSDCTQEGYFSTSGSGFSSNTFSGNNFGVHTQNSGTLIFRGGAVTTSKVPGGSTVCNVNLYYRVYLQSAAPGAFTAMNLTLEEDCNTATSQFSTGQSCVDGDQLWYRVVADGTTTPYAPVDLTALAPGSYFLEIYYDVSGSSTSTFICDETKLLDNSGAYYKASFSVQDPIISGTNPTTCNGSEGYFSITGLAPGVSYAISYTDDGAAVGPDNYVANGAGQLIIPGLDAGLYSDFMLTANGCTTDLSTALILSNPVLIPKFAKIAPFCAGSTAPTLPATSINGISGTWSPSVIDNQTSGTYTFTPAVGQCGTSVNINVTVNPRVTPTFSFGTSLVICGGGTVPSLPNTSDNGITGYWDPSDVDNQASGVYTFTPTDGLCANPTTFTVTVNPNITPTFSFGTSLSICEGATVPSLPTTSDNGITGTWSPSSVDNQASGTYTFTPTAGQCATTTTFTVTVNPNITPTFDFGTALTICAGGIVPTLPATSTNGITGTWSPSTVDNQASGTYTFTPTAGQCATTTTFTVTVNPNITPTFDFGTALTICAGGVVPALPATSTNGITGTWSPSTVDNQNSGTYTFTPTAGQCATTTTFTVTVNPNITPTFSFGTSLSICEGAAVPSLPATSENGIAGSWSPATVDNQASGTYTFTPTAGQCATTTTFTVTVNPNITPLFSFGTALTICNGGGVPALPTTSDNGVSGTWSPSTVDNQASGTYTFTPTSGQCATTTTFTVTVNPNIPPTFSFGTSLVICNGGAVPSLPATSDNGITGVWNPAIVDNQASATYTFTPDAGQCATVATFSVTVNPNITPAFDFGTSSTICAGGTVPALPTTSTNGITGTWSPTTADNQSSATYTFTPTAGQCATTTTFTVTVNPNTTPSFSFGSALTNCAGDAVPTLPLTSDNGIGGSWSPSVVDNQASGVYTFTPTAGQCATTTTFTVTVTQKVIPAFSFGTSLSMCEGATVPSLPATSDNGIAGTWSPATVDNQASGTYTFTPGAGQCATTATFTVTVNPIVDPTFDFGNTIDICAGAAVPDLPATSTNNITGTWSQAAIDNLASGTYTFTPAAGQCANPFTLQVNVSPVIRPVFSFGTTLSICAGSSVPSLPGTSSNGITGTWNTATVSNQTSAVYTFTPDPAQGPCVANATFSVTVNPILTPTFSFGNSLTLCSGTTAPTLPATSSNGLTGAWNPAVIDNQVAGTYTFTVDPGQCAVSSVSLTVAINPVPTVDEESDTTVTDGTLLPLRSFTGSPAGVDYNWTNSNASIGLAAAGTGAVPSFTAVNKGSEPVTGTVSFTPVLNGCSGTAGSYKITVIPLNKEVFVPNVFTPNGDGKNEVLLVYGNYISKLNMRIFNQWGEQLFMTDSQTRGWDGTHKGKAQPVGVYVYALEAVLTDGRSVKMKGYINLIR